MRTTVPFARENTLVVQMPEDKVHMAAISEHTSYAHGTDTDEKRTEDGGWNENKHDAKGNGGCDGGSKAGEKGSVRAGNNNRRKRQIFTAVRPHYPDGNRS